MGTLSILAGISLGALSAAAAHNKGYNAVLWFFGGTGVLGLIVINILSDTTLLSAEAQRKQRIKGNLIGFAMVALTILLLMASSQLSV